MRRTLVLAVFVAACCHTRPTEPLREPLPPPDAAVDTAEARLPEPPAPTLRLDDTLVPVRYQARLSVDPSKPTFRGVVTMDATLTRAASLVWLHADRLDITEAYYVTNDVFVPLEVVPQPADFVGLRAKDNLPAGPIQLQFVYTGTFETHDSMGAFVQPVDGIPYAFTQFEALGARRVFPCVDEPSSKVPWKLELMIPADLTAVSNTPIESDEVHDDARTIRFTETPPLPSYLVAFAVGPFDAVDAGTTPGGAPIRVLAFKGQGQLAGYAATGAAKVLAVLEDYFGSPYPYAKLDFVPIPTTTWFGAMENAGMITFRADILSHATWTETDRRRFGSYLGHEAAHQWFGDLVTMPWWDDIWLNEAFATWMEEKVMSALEPGWLVPESMVQVRAYALGADGLASARMIHQPIVEPDDIQSAFDGITYQKGATVIRMFEHWVGVDTFQKGVRAYLAAHAYGTATSDDFLAAIDAVTDLDVTSAFRTFLDQPGAPRVSASLACAKNAPTRISLHQDRWLPRGAPTPTGAAPRWTLPVCVAYGDDKTRSQACTTLSDEDGVIELAEACPTWILPNADAVGYYRVALDHAAITAVLDHGWAQLAGPERLLFAYDVAAIVARGDAKLGDELALVEELVTPKASKEAIELAAGMAWGAYGVASDAAKPQVAKWIRGTFGKRAAALGWLTAADDSADTQDLRGAVVPLVAIAGDDPKLRAQAKKIVKAWPDVPEVDRGQVAAGAVRGNTAFRDQLIASLASADHREVRDAVEGLGGLDDPDEAAPALAALLDPELDLTISIELVGALAGHEELQMTAAAFIRDHFDELRPRLPDQLVADLVYVFTASCDAGDRAAAETWAQDHLADEIGAPRTIANALEGLDQCVAQKAALGPELDAWLKTRSKPKHK